jgi:hypothetical protein
MSGDYPHAIGAISEPADFKVGANFALISQPSGRMLPERNEVYGTTSVAERIHWA